MWKWIIVYEVGGKLHKSLIVPIVEFDGGKA